MALHGLTKLEMGDVSGAAGISRATLYRYFSSRDDLLTALSIREGIPILGRLPDGVAGRARERGADPPPAPLRHAIQVREHAALQRMLDTEPAYRAPQPSGSSSPPFATSSSAWSGGCSSATQPVRSGVATVGQLVDWMTRLLISAFLIPSSEPDQMLQGLEGHAPRVDLEGADDASNGA